MDSVMWNGCRYAVRPGPMYESYFLRGNHPDRAQAFWIRYTIFHSADAATGPEAELWVALFEEGKAVFGGHERIPMNQSSWNPDKLDVSIREAFLREGEASGKIHDQGTDVSWNLSWEGDAEPLTLLSPRLYRGGFPKAKAVVPRPMVQFTGQICLGDLAWKVNGWPGSQNHNWGSQHTDAYAWGQVMGFDSHPEASLECATARLKLAGLWTPPLSLAILRLGGMEYRFDSLLRAFRSKGHFEKGQWALAVRNGREQLEVEMDCEESAWVSLPYRNPPGGLKRCHNSKVARANVRLTTEGGEQISLVTTHGAAFEILEDLNEAEA